MLGGVDIAGLLPSAEAFVFNFTPTITSSDETAVVVFIATDQVVIGVGFDISIGENPNATEQNETNKDKQVFHKIFWLITVYYTPRVVMGVIKKGGTTKIDS